MVVVVELQLIFQQDLLEDQVEEEVMVQVQQDLLEDQVILPLLVHHKEIQVEMVHLVVQDIQVVEEVEQMR
jgi:hypothetical protein